MHPEFDQSLEVSREVFCSLLCHTDQDFCEHLSVALNSIASQATDLKDLNGRYLTFVNGILKLIYPQNIDEFIYNGAILSVEFLTERDASRKVEILTIGLRSFLTSFRKNRPDKRVSEKVLGYLKKCSLDDFQEITVAQLARRFDYHPGYFGKKYSSEQGHSLQSAILNEKMCRALLVFSTNKNISIKDVAKRLGFSSSIYFSQIFKARFGVLPTKVLQSFEHK